MNKTSKSKSNIIIISIMLICAMASFWVSRIMYSTVMVDGTSMLPNLFHEDYAIVRLTKNVKCGDVVVLDSEGIGMHVVKRVIGLEGDVIEIKYGEDGYAHVWRNGVQLNEDYIKEPMHIAPADPVTIGKGMVYFLGDNRNISNDSHVGHLESVDSIYGKVVLRYRRDRLEFGRVKNTLEASLFAESAIFG